MCDAETANKRPGTKTIPVQEAIGTVLAHDITEIRPGEFKGRAFKGVMLSGKKIYAT